MIRMLPRYRRSFLLIKRANAHRLLNRWAFVRFMAFYTMYFIFLVRGFMVCHIVNGLGKIPILPC